MITQKYKYMVVHTLLTGLERLLNDLEELANGCYDIVSIFNETPSGSRQVVCIVVRVHLIDEELPFDEDEIKRRLGFGD